MPSCKSDSWRRYTCLCSCAEGELGESVQPRRPGVGGKWGLPWGLLCGTSGRRKLCMVLGYSCHFYGIWRSKEVGDASKLSFGVVIQATGAGGGGGGSFMENGGSLLYWNFIVSLTGYYKRFYRIPLLGYP